MLEDIPVAVYDVIADFGQVRGGNTATNLPNEAYLPYDMMQLMQWNWFLDRGVLRVDRASGTMSIDYSRYHDAVRDLLKEVLALQDSGDKAVATAFIGAWDDSLHGRIAASIREQQRVRFRLFEYGALGK